MNKIAFAILLTLCACHKANRLTGREKNSTSDAVATEYFAVACCQDDDGHGNLSWPDFVPQTHRDFCARVHKANHDGQLIDGKVYLDMSVDCGKWGNKIGDEYYAGRSY